MFGPAPKPLRDKLLVSTEVGESLGVHPLLAFATGINLALWSGGANIDRMMHESNTVIVAWRVV